MFYSILIPTLFFLVSFAFTFYYTLILLKALRYRNLFTTINLRSSHNKEVPSLGGLVFYAVAMLSLSISHQLDNNGFALVLMPSLTLIASIGFKDDLIGIKAWKKFIGQIVSLAVMFFLIELNFDHLQLEYDFSKDLLISMGFKVLIFIFMLFFINAFNFIDGIDGLAGGYAFMAFGVLAGIFYSQQQISLMLACITFIGILVAFLYFNTSKEKKIFMGDTGSMLLGLTIISLVLIAYLLKSPMLNFTDCLSKGMILVLLVSYPTYDGLRVVVIRLLNGRKFYEPDQNHVHHILIRTYGWSHLKTALLINTSNLVIFVLSLAFECYFGPLWACAFLINVYVLLSWYLYRLSKFINS